MICVHLILTNLQTIQRELEEKKGKFSFCVCRNVMFVEIANKSQLREIRLNSQLAHIIIPLLLLLENTYGLK